MTKLLPAHPVLAFIAGIFVAIISILAGIIFGFNPFSSVRVIAPTEKPVLEETRSVQDVSSCSNLEGQSLNNCCEEWLVENNLSRVQCIGEWEWIESSCSYSCTVE